MLTMCLLLFPWQPWSADYDDEGHLILLPLHFLSKNPKYTFSFLHAVLLIHQNCFGVSWWILEMPEVDVDMEPFWNLMELDGTQHVVLKTPKNTSEKPESKVSFQNHDLVPQDNPQICEHVGSVLFLPNYTRQTYHGAGGSVHLLMAWLCWEVVGIKRENKNISEWYSTCDFRQIITFLINKMQWSIFATLRYSSNLPNQSSYYITLWFSPFLLSTILA